MEDLPGSSLRTTVVHKKTEDFVTWCKLVPKECRFNDRAGECEVARFTTQFFHFGQAS